MTSIGKLKDRARRFEQKEDWRSAIEVYRKVLETEEAEDGIDLELGLFNRIGDLYLRLGHTDEAVSYYERAADEYSRSGFYNSAIALCNKALRHRPDRPELYLKLSRFCQEQGFTSDARRWILAYAERQLKRGQLDTALAALQDFTRTASAPDVRELLAEQLVDQDRQAEAVDQLHQAFAEWLHLGDEPAANRVAEKIRALDPESAPPVHLETDRDDEPDQDRDSAVPGADDVDHPDDHQDGIEPDTDHDVVDADVDGFEHHRTEDVAAPSSHQALEGLESGRDEPQPESTGEPAQVDDLESFQGPDDDATLDDDEPPPLPLLEGSYRGDQDEEPVDDQVAHQPQIAPEQEVPEAPEPEAVETREPDLPEPEAREQDTREQEVLEPEPEEAVAEGCPEPEAAAAEDRPEPEDAVAEGRPEPEEAAAEDRPEPEGLARPAGSLMELDLGEGFAAGGPISWGEWQDLEGDPLDLDLGVQQLESSGRAQADLDVDTVLDRSKELVSRGLLNEALAEIGLLLGTEAPPAVFKDALSVANEIARRKPGDIRSLQRRVEFASRTGERSLLVATYMELANSLGRAGEDANALSIYRRVLALDPDNEEAKAVFGILDVDEGGSDPDDASDDGAEEYEMGVAFLEMGLIDQAISEFRSSLQRAPARVAAYEQLARCFMTKGDYALATKILRRGLEVAGDDDTELMGVYYHLGQCHEELGQRAEARQAYEHVLRIEPEFDDVAERMSRL